MKNIILAFLAVFAMGTLATPAAARGHGSSEPSANDWMRYDEHNCSRDPGYCSAVRGGHYGGYGYNNYDGYGNVVVVDNSQTEEHCLLWLFVCSSHPKRNHPGDVCYDGHDVPYGLDKEMRWYRFPDSMPVSQSAKQRHLRCGWNTDDVTYAEPTPPPSNSREGSYYVQDGRLVAKPNGD